MLEEDYRVVVHVSQAKVQIPMYVENGERHVTTQVNNVPRARLHLFLWLIYIGLSSGKGIPNGYFPDSVSSLACSLRLPNILNLGLKNFFLSGPKLLAWWDVLNDRSQSLAVYGSHDVKCTSIHGFRNSAQSHIISIS